jgi:hypothetical protein
MRSSATSTAADEAGGIGPHLDLLCRSCSPVLATRPQPSSALLPYSRGSVDCSPLHAVVEGSLFVDATDSNTGKNTGFRVSCQPPPWSPRLPRHRPAQGAEAAALGSI